MGRLRHVAIAALVVAGALGVGGCDGSTSFGRHRIAAGPLIIYTSLPMIGPTAAEGRAVLRGEETALAAAHGRVGHYRIVLRTLDDATASSLGWNPGQTDSGAILAARQARTIGYLGDLSSGATAVSLPVLNRAHIPQLSPLATAVGLTRGGAEAAPGEPQGYYPAVTRTFVRIVPNDVVQSAVQVAVQRDAGCDRIEVLYGSDFDGRDAAASYLVAARQAGLRVIGSQLVVVSPAADRSLATRLATLAPDCVMVSADNADDATALTDAIAAALPQASLFATSVPAEPGFVAHPGGVALADDPQLTITYPTLAASDYPPAGRRFLRDFDRRFGSGGLQAIWGDAAMALLLDAIRRASDDGREDVTRTRVLRALFATRDEPSVLGTYSITPTGDTTLRAYGVYHVVAGRLVFWKSMQG